MIDPAETRRLIAATFAAAGHTPQQAVGPIPAQPTRGHRFVDTW